VTFLSGETTATIVFTLHVIEGSSFSLTVTLTDPVNASISIDAADLVGTAGAPPATDPYFAGVVLLIHPDNPIVDKSSYAHSLAITDVAIQSATFLDNTIVLRSSSTVDSAIDAGSSSAFARANGTPFTVEWSMRVNSLTASNIYYLMGYSNAQYVKLTADGTGTTYRLSFEYGSGVTLGTSFTPSTWYQFGLSYDGDKIRAFVNGALTATSGTSPNLGISGTPTFGVFNVFNRADLQRPLADITEVRLTNGVARFVADYTPSTTQFPNS
jgi:hypothetical protein